MHNRRFPAALIAGALFAGLCAAMPAHGDGVVTPTYIGMTPQDVGVMDRPRPAYDAKGIPLGGFRLFPTLDLDASYDDNVFRLPTAQSDYFFTISPALRLQSQWGRHFFEIYGGLNDYQYMTFSGENLIDWKVGADGRLDISRAAMVSANVFYGEFHELWSSPNSFTIPNATGYQSSPNRYYQTHADIQTAYQPNRLGIGFGASYDHYNWLATPAFGGGTLYNTDRNEDEYQGYAKLFYDFSPGYSGFVKASYDDRHFDHLYDRSGLDRSSHGYRFDGGLDMQLTHLLAGELFVGYLDQSFAQNVPTPLPDVSGLDYGAQLDWYASPVLTVHLSGSRQLADVIIDNASVADNKSVALSADYEFRRNIIVQGRVFYTDSRFVGTTRDDTYPGAGIGVIYLLNRYMSANLNYNYSERSTNGYPEFNFTDDTVSVGLTLHL
jgi:hypothetical protein